MPLSNSQTRDVESLIHPYTDLAALRETGPTVIERGRGVHVWDVEGRRYIEGMGGLWCTALGYGNEEMAEAAREQVARLSFGHLFAGKGHDLAIELAEKIKAMSPAPTSKVLFTASGSEANDTQVKLAWYYNNAIGKPERKKIVSRIRAYHGVTLAASSLTGLPNNHVDFDVPLPRFLHTHCPHRYRFAHEGESEEEFATRLAADFAALVEAEGPDTIAAFIAEPIMGAGGVIVPPATYFEKMQAVLRRYDIAFIVDEVITGFGRLGEPFASEVMGLKPDTVSIAKALTSAYAPLGAVTVSEKVYEAMLDESRKIGQFSHGFTYSGHPLSIALALKALEIYARDDVFGHAARIAPAFQQHVRTLADHPLVGEARGMGLMGGLELVADKPSKHPFAPGAKAGLLAVRLIQEEGVILRALGDVIAICPPLVITEEEIGALFGAVRRGLDRALDGLPRPGQAH